MNAAFDDERLSAYLDGELPPDERQALDARLAHDGELRQALEELRALGAAMRSLPRHRLDDGFSADVLRRAEIEMLTGNGPSATPIQTAVPTQTASPTQTVAPARDGVTSRPFSYRALLWTAATIGIAAIIWKQFDAPRGREIAREAPTAEKTTDKDAPGQAGPTNYGAQPPTVSAIPRASDTPALESLEDRPRDGETRDSLGQPGLTQSDAKGSVVRSSPPFQFEARKGGASAGARATVDDRLADARQAGEAGKDIASLESSAGQHAQAVDQLAVKLTASDAVVVCEITPEAASGGLVYQLLADQAIDPAEEVAAESLGDQWEKKTFGDVKREARRAENDQAALPSGQANDLAKAAKRPEFSDVHGTDLLEIEATPQQIAGFLTAMRQRSGAVTAVHELKRANVAPAGNVLAKGDRGRSVRKFAKEALPAQANEPAVEETRSADLESRRAVAPSREAAPAAAVPTAPAPAAAPPAEREKPALPVPAPKSAPTEEAPRADDATPTPAESAPSRSVRVPDRPLKSATEKAKAAPKSLESADVRLRSQVDRSAKPSGPAIPQKDKSESAGAGAESATASKQLTEQPRSQASARGFYRKLTIQPEQAKPPGGFGGSQGDKGGQVDKVRVNKGQDDKWQDGDGQGAKAQDGDESAPGRGRPNRFDEQENAGALREKDLTRQKVVLLIQVRPPLAAAPIDGDPVPVPAPAAVPAPK